MEDFEEQKLRLPELSEKIFCKNGYARALPNFEHRPEQERMAYACAQAFAADSALLFEAGTGIGKSMAYLVPGIIAATRFNRQLIVATRTIALQQQIMQKDLPRIRSLFDACGELADCAGFRAAILMGRSNYLCSHRLRRALAERRELFDTEESKELDRIADWSLKTSTGFVEELDPPPNPDVWAWVNAESSSCTARNCSDGQCFYQNARRAVGEADVVVLNHSLLFSMMAAGLNAEDQPRGILFPNDMLVMDEAHLVPDAATECFGTSLSSFYMARELKRIYDPAKKRGLITRQGLAESRDKQIVREAIDCARDFFAGIAANFLSSRDTIRLTAPDWVDLEICSKLDTLARMLDALAQNARTDSLSAEIKDYKRSVVGMKNTIEDCAWLADDNSVYWAELAKGKKSDGVRLNSAPIDVSQILRRKVFSRSTAAIMTSATLASDGSMDAFAGKIGAETAESFVCKSPFDYPKNMRVLVDTSAPEPDRDSMRLDCEPLARAIERLAAQVSGGTLALFTSHRELNKCASLLEGSDLAKARNIYVQGRLKRGAAAVRFARDGNALLLGTDTFWTGIDIPGDALCQVIITRLPFENFKHPLAEAKMERAQAMGENPFLTISIPNAVTKFRQGIGRLIRSKNDRGIVVILDSRIATKHYGLKFTSALPTPFFARCNSENLIERAREAAEELGILKA